MRSEATVLFVSGDPAETIVFERILGEYMALKRVEDLAELKAAMANGKDCDAVLCGLSFRKGDWKDAVRYVLEPGPESPVIVFRRMGIGTESVEVIGAGPFDLMARPDERDPVLAVLEYAVASYEVRHMKTGLHSRPTPRQAEQRRSEAPIATRQVHRETRRISPLPQVPDVTVGVSPS